MGIIQDVFHQEGLVSFLCQELHTKINSITLFWGERNRIERVFDIVYVRWGVLWRPLTLKIDLIHLDTYQRPFICQFSCQLLLVIQTKKKLCLL